MKKIAPACLLIALICATTACTSKTNQQDSNAEPFEINVENLEAESRINVTVNGDLFTSYMYADTFEKPFIFPVVAANGTTVTRGYPIEPSEGESVDHPHHTGYWFTYGNVNGIDFWGNSKMIPDSDKHRYGTIRLKGIHKIESLPDRGIIELSQEWVNPDGSIPLEEHVTYTFYAGKDYRIIDRMSTLSTSMLEVSFADTKEGAFAIRVTKFLEFPSDQPQKYIDDYGNITEVPAVNNEGVNGNYLSSEGIEGGEVWGKRAKWMNLYGTQGPDTLSLVIMDHPSNLNYPTYWHARTYGLFSANPFGVKDFTEGEEELNFILKAAETLTFRHRLYIKSGNEFSAPEIEANWKEFTEQH
jgi:hypothetical protein